MKSKRSWSEELREVLIDLGGTAYLSEIYGRVEERNIMPLLYDWKLTIRCALETYCSQCSKYDGKNDWFYIVEEKGKGHWGLRDYQYLSNNKSVQDMLLTISEYAAVYRKLELLQRDQRTFIQVGDQKTGVFGEFYAYLFTKEKYKDKSIILAQPSEKAWDIKVTDKNTDIKIQVKTVSAYSMTRTISPIHKGWDVLYLISLDESFLPNGFWIHTDKSIMNNISELKGKKMQNPYKSVNEQSALDFKENKVGELLAVIKKYEKESLFL